MGADGKRLTPKGAAPTGFETLAQGWGIDFGKPAVTAPEEEVGMPARR